MEDFNTMVQRQVKTIVEEVREAQAELSAAEQDLNLADAEFIDTATYKYNAAMYKLDALTKEAK